MRLPRVRFTLRRLMIVVAAVATFMVAWMEIARWKEKRKRCEILLDVYGENPFQQWASLTHDQWLAWCRDIDEQNRVGGRKLGNMTVTLLYPPSPESARRAAERWERFKQQCEWTYAHPWWPVEPGPPPFCVVRVIYKRVFAQSPGLAQRSFAGTACPEDRSFVVDLGNYLA